MKVMVIVKATQASEAGEMPSKELIHEMGTYNEQLIKAGVMLAGDGLQPSSKGARIKFGKGKQTVTDGPFAETKELIAGFWIIEVKSKAEALQWAKRIPFSDGQEVELRQFFEVSDFPAEVMPPEEAKREEKMRKDLQAKAKK